MAVTKGVNQRQRPDSTYMLVTKKHVTLMYCGGNPISV